MKKTVALCIIFVAVVSGCAHVDPDGLFNDDQLALLKSSAEALDFGCGFDAESRLHYVYEYSYSRKNFDAKINEFSKVLNQAGVEKAEALYYRVLRIQAQIGEKKDWYRKMKRWNGYTYMANYLEKTTGDYADLLRKNLAGRVHDFESREAIQKGKAAEWAKWYYRYDHEPADAL